ncbi:hypothetical protein K438DRAFT_1764627 [Mycena galopus ATCC 62051]|nr:hypothetical protein K438DRAFT_1764627 [Mycena galopus ATCC 62051]
MGDKASVDDRVQVNTTERGESKATRDRPFPTGGERKLPEMHVSGKGETAKVPLLCPLAAGSEFQGDLRALHEEVQQGHRAQIGTPAQQVEGVKEGWGDVRASTGKRGTATHDSHHIGKCPLRGTSLPKHARENPHNRKNNINTGFSTIIEVAYSVHPVPGATSITVHFSQFIDTSVNGTPTDPLSFIAFSSSPQQKMPTPSGPRLRRQRTGQFQPQASFHCNGDGMTETAVLKLDAAFYSRTKPTRVGTAVIDKFRNIYIKIRRHPILDVVQWGEPQGPSWKILGHRKSLDIFVSKEGFDETDATKRLYHGKEEVTEEKANGNTGRWWYLRWRGDKGADEGSRKAQGRLKPCPHEILSNETPTWIGMRRREKPDKKQILYPLFFGIKKLKKQAVPNTDRVSKTAGKAGQETNIVSLIFWYQETQETSGSEH